MKIKFLFKKLKKKGFKDYLNRTHYLHYYEHYALKDNMILLESQRGANLNGNIFYLLQELRKNPDYSSYDVSVVFKKEKKEDFQALINTHQIQNVSLVRINSRKYYQLCAKAKYLINDTSFLPFFIKKEGQIILNTWHGTPLKCLGKKDNSGYHNLGNVQRNFMCSDYLLYPNKYMRKHMIEDYMLENVTKAKSLMAGYPRNQVFFDESSREEILAMLRDSGEISEDCTKIYAYMPTWRGSVSAVNQTKQTHYIMYYLYEMDKHLQNDEVLYVNLHPFVQSIIDYKAFRHILPFPKEYETYEFLNIADVLITDYSSVFFDFANTKKKIVIFAYDEEEYFADRGVYLMLEDLPFPVVDNAKHLVDELRLPKNYDDTDFLKTYCSYDAPDISKKILDQVILNKEKYLEEIEMPNNGKDNVLMYVGNMAKNGITTSLMSLLNSIDLTKRNYYITFTVAKVRKNRESLLALPEGVNYFPMMGLLNANIFEKICMMLYRGDLFASRWMQKMLNRLYSHDIRRYYYEADFKNIIQFNGYEYKRILEFARFDANRIIYVHNNMEEEIRVRQNQHVKTLEYAYNTYDKVAIVTHDMKKPTMTYCHDENRIHVVNNTIDYQSIKSKGDMELVFDPNTVCEYTEEELLEILNNQGKKFITIGRFSPEKGHIRLIDAFYQVWLEDNSVYLVIIGGHGVKYNETIEHANSLPCHDNIIIIKAMSNPQTVLRLCDYFVLSSFHEGLGLVLMEADIQGLPVISTDILGPSGFLREHGGLLVENSEQGLIDGMRKCLAGDVKVMNVDYEAYNQNAVQQFEDLLV